MKLRLATIDDLDSLAELGARMHAESTFAGMDFDPEILKDTLLSLINREQFLVVAEGNEGVVIGGMAGQVTQSWFGGDLVANDLALFVSSDKRGGFIAYKLIDAFVNWAKLAGAKQIRPSVSTGSTGAEVLYERLGFKRCGSTYFMEGV